MQNGASGNDYCILEKVGADSSLILGETFKWNNMTNFGFANSTTDIVHQRKLKVTAGTLINNADLSDMTVEVASGVTLGGTGTYPSFATPASYTLVVSASQTLTLPVAVDYSDGAASKAALSFAEPEDWSALDTETTYTLLTASSISGWDKEIKASLPKGKWTLVQSGNSLVLRFVKKGLLIIISANDSSDSADVSLDARRAG